MKKNQSWYEHLKKCPVCSSSSHTPFKKATFDFSSLKKEQIKITDSDYGKIWNLSCCEHCTHIFANPCPSPESILSLYSEIEDPLYQEEAPGRSKNFDRILSLLEKIHPEKGILFDVGAATGILLKRALQRGWQPAGIEASSWAVRTARQKYNLQLIKGDFERAQIRKNYYTAVTMVDFIEHIPRPLEALEKAFSILAPGGSLCLVTPDINSLAARIAGKRWWHLRAGHLSFFTSKSLHTLLRRSRFKVLTERKYTWTFSVYYLISRRQRLKFLIMNPFLSSFLKKIQIKLVLGDSFEIYARKEARN